MIAAVLVLGVIVTALAAGVVDLRLRLEDCKRYSRELKSIKEDIDRLESHTGVKVLKSLQKSGLLDGGEGK